MFHVELRIEPGHLVLCYTGYDYIHSIYIPKEDYENSFTTVRGVNIRHKDIIGLPYGCKVQFGSKGLKRLLCGEVSEYSKESCTASKKEIIKTFHLLRPTSSLVSKSLRHQTQIIFPEDMAAICSELNLGPGSQVLESGTGSGSLTHRLALSVIPNGKVTTVEFHATRYDKLKCLFADNQLLGSVIHMLQGDITCPSTIECMQDGSQDGIFLDIPNPWDFLKSNQDRVLKTGGCFASFSPCIEQIQKTVAELTMKGSFTNIRTVEIQARWYDMPLDFHCSNKGDPGWLTDQTFPGQMLQGRTQRLLPSNAGFGHTAYMTFALRV